jgi:hypothetical protein
MRYVLVFRLLSPLCVGAGRVGNLQRTRGYVPGKVLWAALTSKLARALGRPRADQYIEMGRRVSEMFRFGYLYPALAEGPEYRVSRPWDPDFDYRFLSSYASTALKEDTASAEDGSLHETEFISPQAEPLTEDDGASPVYLKGQVWVQGEGVPGWQEAVRELQIGADRGYGWGRVVLASELSDGTPEEPRWELPKGTELESHLDESTAGNSISGNLEVLVGWERNNSGGHPWRVSQPRLCYRPGSKVKEAGVKIVVVEFGIWKRV